METVELLEAYIYPNLDVKSLLEGIFIKEKQGAYILECPSCGKEEAYLIKRHNTIIPFINCNRLNKCAYTSSLWDYIKNRERLNNKNTLWYLAAHANIDMKNFSYSKNYYKNEHTQQKQKTSTRSEQEYYELKNVDKYYKMELLIEGFQSLPEKLQFSTIVTLIYNFSLKNNQKYKEAYYKNRGILNTNNIGSLNYQDMIKLESKLLENFDLKSLQKFNIFKEKRFKYSFSSFSVVPSFDLYSNLISAIRLRNMNKSKIKEIEISHLRIANPLPFGVTKEKLLKYDTFYFTEGHIDALSLNLENFVAVEGVNSFNKKNLGYFKGKNIVILFDQDDAGKEGAKKLMTSANILNIKCSSLIWDKKYGKDINELLVSNNISLLSKIFYNSEI